MAFNALKYVDELVEVGVPEKQAKAQVLILQDFKDSEMATKGDVGKTEAALKHDTALVQKEIKETEARLKHDIALVQKEIKETEAGLKHDIALVQKDIRETEAKLKKEIKETEARLKHDIALVQKDIKGLELKMTALEDRMVIKLGSLLLVGLGALVALSKLNII